MVVLINGYLGVLTSMLSIPKLEPIFFTVKEVVESGELGVTIEKNSALSTQFLVYFGYCHSIAVNSSNFIKTILQDATEGYEKIVGNRLREDPYLLVVDVYGTLENVVNKKTRISWSVEKMSVWQKRFLMLVFHCFRRIP